jgi:hypothetical protein
VVRLNVKRAAGTRGGVKKSKLVEKKVAVARVGRCAAMATGTECGEKAVKKVVGARTCAATVTETGCVEKAGASVAKCERAFVSKSVNDVMNGAGTAVMNVSSSFSAIVATVITTKVL